MAETIPKDLQGHTKEGQNYYEVQESVVLVDSHLHNHSGRVRIEEV